MPTPLRCLPTGRSGTRTDDRRRGYRTLRVARRRTRWRPSPPGSRLDLPPRSYRPGTRKEPGRRPGSFVHRRDHDLQRSRPHLECGPGTDLAGYVVEVEWFRPRREGGHGDDGSDGGCHGPDPHPAPAAVGIVRCRDEQTGGQVDHRQGAHCRAGLVDLVETPPTAQTVLEVGDDAERLGRARLTVEVDRQKLFEVCHPTSCSDRALRSCLRPRWMRLRTVPTGTATAAAISS